jgi:hypothetical protein
MSVVRGIWADLVDKRLWPVALALVVAAVAIPVLLLKPAKAVDTAASAPVTGAVRLPSGVSVSLDQTHAQGMLLDGRLHDPFHQLHIPATTSSSSSSLGPSTASTSGPSGSSAPGGGGSPGSESSGSSGGGGGGGSHSGSSSHHSSSAASVQVAFGQTGSSLKTYDLASQSALVASGEPILVFLGVQKDGRTAAFLVSSDAAPQGDGRCSPSASVCTTLYMKAGDTSFIDVTANGANVQYELDVKRVSG